MLSSWLAWNKGLLSSSTAIYSTGISDLVDERCGGTFDNIDDVIAPAEREAFMAGYKKAAGFAIEHLNAAPRTIAEGARVQAAVT